MLIIDLSFKKRHKKTDLPPNCFQMRDISNLMKDKYEYSKEDISTFFEMMMEKRWIEMVYMEEKKMKDETILRLV